MDTSGLPAGAGIRVRDRERFHILVGRGLSAPAPVSLGAPPPVGEEPACAVGSVPVPVRGAVGGVGALRRDGRLHRAAGGLDGAGGRGHPGPGRAAAAPAGRLPHGRGRRGGGPSRCRQSRPVGAGPGELGQPQLTSMVAWCTLAGDRVDVLEWISWLTAYDRVLADGFSPFHGGRPLVVMPVLLINGELGFEYPDRAWDLVTALGEAGFSLDGHPHRAGRRDHHQQGPADQPGPGRPGRCRPPGRRRSGRRGRQRPVADRAADRHTVTASR